MQYNLCSISFRHQLSSFEEIVRFGRKAGFSGLELWGVHATALCAENEGNIGSFKQLLHRCGMRISMISDYINLLSGECEYDRECDRFGRLIEIALAFGAGVIRIFPGTVGSREAGREARQLCACRIRELAGKLAGDNLLLALETHPYTLADTLESTVSLMEEIDHPAARINLDFLHLWETGTPPILAYESLKQWVVNFHVKNISHREFSGVFEPTNIYTPNGSREGIVSLEAGVVDYSKIIRHLASQPSPPPISIEWFGREPKKTLLRELSWLRASESEQPLPAAAPQLYQCPESGLAK